MFYLQSNFGSGENYCYVTESLCTIISNYYIIINYFFLFCTKDLLLRKVFIFNVHNHIILFLFSMYI